MKRDIPRSTVKDDAQDPDATAPTPMGWYPDPWGEHERRYWDGSEWTGRTQDAPDTQETRHAPDAPATTASRRIDPIAILIGIATAAAAVVAVMSFGEGREKLALVAVALALPLAVANVVQLVRARPATRRPVVMVVTAWLVVAAVVAVGGYRGFQSKPCTTRLGPDAKLAGCGLSGRDLTRFDLHGADLSRANLTNTDLENVNLSGANLAGADLSDAQLNNANLTGADLTGATLRNTDLTSSTLDRAVLRDATLDRTKLDSTSAQDANLGGAKLHNLSGVAAKLAFADLRAAEVKNTNLSSAVLDGANFEGAVLQDTNLESASLFEANFKDTTMTNVTLDHTYLENAAVTDKVLAGAFGVDPLDVAKSLSDRGLMLEPESAMTTALQTACSGSPVANAGTSPANGAFVVTINSGSTTFAWPTQPPALRYVELVACVGPITSVDVDECGPYFYTDGSVAHPITRYRESIAVTLVNPSTGAVVAQRTFDAPEPDPCPISVSASVYRLGGELDQPAVQAGITDMVTAAGA